MTNDPLGMVYARFRTDPTKVVFLFLFAALFAAITIGLVVNANMNGLGGVALVCGVSAVGFAIWGWTHAKHELQILEHGVKLIMVRRRVSVRFDEITSVRILHFTYKGTQQGATGLQFEFADGSICTFSFSTGVERAYARIKEKVTPQVDA